MRYLSLLLLSSTLFASPALDRLVEGNQRFVSGHLEHPDRDQERRDETAFSQKPFAIVLTCSDSRVAPEIIFDQGIGDLFVIRVAGNVVGPFVKESIDYSAIALESDILVVMGHERCGAVGAVLEHHTELIPDIAILIDPAAKRYPKNLEMAIKQNALNMASLLKRTPSLAQRVKEGKLEVVPAYYDLDTGKVVFLSKSLN